jgi:hypothetical protein
MNRSKNSVRAAKPGKVWRRPRRRRPGSCSAAAALLPFGGSICRAYGSSTTPNHVRCVRANATFSAEREPLVCVIVGTVGDADHACSCAPTASCADVAPKICFRSRGHGCPVEPVPQPMEGVSDVRLVLGGPPLEVLALRPSPGAARGSSCRVADDRLPRAFGEVGLGDDRRLLGRHIPG